MATAVKILEVKQDRIFGLVKDNQCQIVWTGFDALDLAKKADLKNLLSAVITIADFIQKESGERWKAKHNLVLPYMWKYMTKYNFGFSLYNGYYSVPYFMIVSDRETQPMVKLGLFEALLKELTK